MNRSKEAKSLTFWRGSEVSQEKTLNGLGSDLDQGQRDPL